MAAARTAGSIPAPPPYNPHHHLGTRNRITRIGRSYNSPHGLHRGVDGDRWTTTTSIQHDWHDLGHPRERTIRATGSLSRDPVGTDGASHAEQIRPDDHEHTGGNLRSGQERGTANKQLELSRATKWQRLRRVR
jgi:hypothetical protein